MDAISASATGLVADPVGIQPQEIVTLARKRGCERSNVEDSSSSKRQRLLHEDGTGPVKHTRGTKPFPLLSLPRQLRQMIFASALKPSDEDSGQRYYLRSKGPAVLGLTNTCRQIYKETKVLRDNHPFLFTMDVGVHLSDARIHYDHLDLDSIARCRHIILVIKLCTKTTIREPVFLTEWELMVRRRAQEVLLKLKKSMPSLAIISIAVKGETLEDFGTLFLRMLFRVFGDEIEINAEFPTNRYDPEWIHNWPSIVHCTSFRRDRIRKRTRRWS